METIIKHGTIPKVICIPVEDITGIVSNFSFLSGIGELDELGLHVLMTEVGEILTSPNPDTPYPLNDNTTAYLAERGSTFKQFIIFKQYLIKAIDHYLRQIEIVRTNWREHADPYLKFSYNDDGRFINITFNPVYPSRDFSGALMKEVELARLNNEFIPYKYLRILGMC